MDEVMNQENGNDQIQKLRQVASEPTPSTEIRWRDADRSGNKKYPYTDPAYVIATLNDIFGFHWSFVVEHEELIYFNDQPFEVKVRGRLIVPLNDQKVTKMQYGAATIEWMKERESGKLIKPVMIADAYKSAASDALKKCASELGIAHDVYDSDSPLHKGNRQNHQQGQQQQTRPQPVPAPKPAPTASTPSTSTEIALESQALIEITDALLTIWVQMGKKPSDFATYRAEKLKGKTVAELRAILEKWQTAALQGPKSELAQQKVAAETHDKGSGLDQWRCTKESNGSRKLALDVINICARLEATGCTEAMWREQLNDLFSGYEPPVSRKTLSAKECDDLIHVFTKWAEQREKKAAEAAQSAKVA